MNSFYETFLQPFTAGPLKTTFVIIWVLAPIWAPIFFGTLFWHLWRKYVVIWFLFNQKMTLLELKLPSEVFKTPLAMELVFTAMHLTFGETTFIDRNWLGKRRTFFSLELVSDGGDIHFYIWTRAFFKNQVEAAFYAQYPEIEITEVEDYTLPYWYDRERMELFGVEFVKNGKQDVVPIKTYVDYGLDQAGAKEEEKIDPMTTILEYLGGVHRGGHAWIQIIIEAHKSDRVRIGSRFKKTDWRNEGEDLVDQILQRGKHAPPVKEGQYPQFPRPSPGEVEGAKAVERNIDKLAFNVGMRGIYFADKESFNGIHVIGLLSCWKQFNTPGANGFSTATRWHYKMAWPWEDFQDIRKHRFARKVMEYYKRRAFFHPPYQQKSFTMSTEELATIFHIPGTVANTPSLPRLSSKRAEPPPDLPI